MKHPRRLRNLPEGRASRAPVSKVINMADTLHRSALPNAKVLKESAKTRRIAVAELRRRAETRLRDAQGNHRPEIRERKSEAGAQRLLHELQVHQVELEMQNAELQGTRDRMEVLVERYTDLYDFAPVGYFSLDERGRILEVNLTGAALLGVERSRLINQPFPSFVTGTTQPVFRTFLERLFSGSEKQVCEATLRNADGATFWANFHGVLALSITEPRKWCRVAVSDISGLKQAQEAQRRLEALTVVNRELRREIVQRQAVEKALRESEEQQSQLLEQSRHMQAQLRDLSHRMLRTQEEERKRISRELHDEITQTLVGINVHLETLAHAAIVNPVGLRKQIARTQRLVERSVDIVHQFARELRPTALDDLGLIRALHAFMKDFTKRSGIHVQFTTVAGVERLNSARRAVLYRVVQSALTNVAQHAHASRVKVSMRKLGNTLHLEIADNGRSFDVERLLRDKTKKHLGLLGMRERVEMVAGDFHIESVPGKGTTIRAELPFRSGARA